MIKCGFICIIIILIATLIVAYLQFGFPFNIRYETGDPATHYLTSTLFSNQDRLLNLNKDVIYGKLFTQRKIASYVNSGIIMKCVSGIVNELDYYNIFIGFGIFVLFMTGTMMYIALDKFTKCKRSKILALIVSIIFMMGYPLNSLIFGFEYMSLALLIILTILCMIYYFEKKELVFGYYLIIFAFLNFGLFCSYFMFVPFVYSALWIYFCIYSYKKYKKVICKKNINILITTLIIPFILGYIYHLAPSIYNIFNSGAWESLQSSVETSKNMVGGFKVYGYIYINYYSNALLLLPLTIYYIIKKRKEKELASFDIIAFIATVVFIIILIFGKFLGQVSAYYLMKNYFALWIFLIYMNFRGLMYIFDKKKIVAFGIVIGYILLIIINLTFRNFPIDHEAHNKYENITNLVEIFGVNKTLITDREIDYTKEEIEVLKYAKENLDFSNNKIEIYGKREQVKWTYSFLRYINEDEITKKYGAQEALDKKWATIIRKFGEVNYVIYFKSAPYFEKMQKYLFENADIIFENDVGGIVKYNIEEG